jgi:hypothetical protein
MWDPPSRHPKTTIKISEGPNINILHNSGTWDTILAIVEGRRENVFPLSFVEEVREKPGCEWACNPVVGWSSGTLPTMVQILVLTPFPGFIPGFSGVMR